VTFVSLREVFLAAVDKTICPRDTHSFCSLPCPALSVIFHR